MGDFSRARDITISVARQQGAPLTLLINSGSIDFGLSSEEIPLVGESTPRVEGINGAKTLQLDTNSADLALFDLLDEQRNFNDQVSNNDTYRVTATFKVDLPNGTVAKYRMPKCTLHSITQSFSGSTERTTTSFSLMSQNINRVS